MPDTRWTAVDDYFNNLLLGPDPALEEALKASAEAGLPAISVAPNQGKLLQLLALTAGARSILEVGTLGGYSTIWLARALPADGRLLSLELDPKHAEVARANLARAGFGEPLAEVRVGPALESLQALAGDDRLPFDLVFVDADKANIPGYFRAALDYTRPGGLIVVDNVVRGGAVADADSQDPNVRGVREFTELVATEPRVSATAIQTVGSKGYDGLAILRVSP